MSICLLLSCLASPHAEGNNENGTAESTEDNTTEESTEENTEVSSEQDSEISTGVRKEYEDEKTTAKAYEGTVKLLTEEIYEINKKIAETSLSIDNKTGEINALDIKIEEAERLYIEYEDRITFEKDKIKEIVSYMYEANAGRDEIASILQSDDIAMVINRDEYLDQISKYYNKKLNEYDSMVAEAEEYESELKNLKLERENEIADLEKQKEKLSADIKELGALMKEAEKKAEDAKELSNALAEKVAELEAEERAVLAARRFDGSNSNVDYSGNGNSYYYEDPYPYTPDELLLMAGIIQAEAGSVSYPGMVAVGSVVMNRVNSPNFGNTIAGVVYAPYQFEPAGTGRLAIILAEGPVDSCMSVAKEVLEGKRNVPNLYFKAAWYAEEHGISGVNIGGNVFH